MKGKERRMLRAKYHTINPEVWVGKKGINSGLIENIKKILEKKRVVKIKVQKSLIKEKDIKDVAMEIIKYLNNVEIIDIRGRTILLYKTR